MDSTKCGHLHVTSSIYIVALSLATVAFGNTASPFPNNAALFYYQAFLLCPDFAVMHGEVVRAVLEKPAVPEDVIGYVDKHKDAIQVLTMASSMQRCEWGMCTVSSSLGAPAEPIVARQARSAAFLVCADARICAARRDYQAALIDCLTVRRLAAHLSTEVSILEGVPINVESYVLYSIQQILNDLPLDEQVLSLLADQMACIPPVSDQLWSHLNKRCEQELRRSKGLIVTAFRTQIQGRITADTPSEKDRLPADEAFFERIHQSFATYFRLVRDMLESNRPYPEKYAGLERLADGLRKEVPANPSIMLGLITSAADMTPRLYNLQLSHRSLFNAMTVAVELYRVKAATGQLPLELPDGLLKDPYSAEAFVYGQTPDGFILRGQIKPTDRREPWEYKFIVREG